MYCFPLFWQKVPNSLLLFLSHISHILLPLPKLCEVNKKYYIRMLIFKCKSRVPCSASNQNLVLYCQSRSSHDLCRIIIMLMLGWIQFSERRTSSTKPYFSLKRLSLFSGRKQHATCLILHRNCSFCFPHYEVLTIWEEAQRTHF